MTTFYNFRKENIRLEVNLKQTCNIPASPTYTNLQYTSLTRATPHALMEDSGKSKYWNMYHVHHV